MNNTADQSRSLPLWALLFYGAVPPFIISALYCASQGWGDGFFAIWLWIPLVVSLLLVPIPIALGFSIRDLRRRRLPEFWSILVISIYWSALCVLAIWIFGKLDS